MRTGWPSVEKTSVRGCESRRWIPSRDSKNAIDNQLQDATSVLDAFHIVKLAGDARGEVRRRVQQVRYVFHQATPAQDRRLAARLIESLPTCPIPKIARLGRTLRKWKDAFLAYFDTAGASNGPTEAINGHYRTRQTHRQRLPQPHQLQTPNAPHRRRPRRLHPHPTLKSLKT